MVYQVPETAIKDKVYSATPYQINETSSSTFGSRKIWEMVWSGKTWAGNDNDGRIYTLPNFYKLVDIRGICVISSSYARVPVPITIGTDYIYPRVTDGGEVWLRHAGGNFNSMDLFLFIKYMQK